MADFAIRMLGKPLEVKTDAYANDSGFKSTYVLGVTSPDDPANRKVFSMKVSKLVPDKSIVAAQLADNSVTSRTISEGAISNMNKFSSDMFNSADKLLRLDNTGKIPTALLNINAMEYLGSFDPTTTNTNAKLTQAATTAGGAGHPNRGDVLWASKDGIVDGVNYYVGDWAIYNGSAWERSANTNNHTVSVEGTQLKITTLTR